MLLKEKEEINNFQLILKYFFIVFIILYFSFKIGYNYSKDLTLNSNKEQKIK